MTKLFTTKEAAEKLNYASDAVIRRLIKTKQINAEKIGHVWVIPEKELEKLKRVKKPYKKRTS